MVKSGDGGLKYRSDLKFLQDCLLYMLCCGNYRIDSDAEFYKCCEKELDKEHKENEIYKLYKELVKKTNTNGLKNIEKYKTKEYGDLYVHMTFGPNIDRLKKLLSIFQYEVIRPKMLEYELLK